MKKANLSKKAKIYFILLVIFTILTFAGAIYVIKNNGEPNAGYACVPMVFSLTFGGLFHKTRNEINNKK